MLGGIGGQEKGTTEDEMAGWHHQLDGHEFKCSMGIGDGQGAPSNHPHPHPDPVSSPGLRPGVAEGGLPLTVCELRQVMSPP